MKNFFLKNGVRFFQKFIEKKSISPPDRILVVSTTALGDTLWATPAIASLKSSFPHAYIACLTSPVGAEVLKHNPHLDQIYPLSRPIWPKILPLQQRLLQERFDTILLFHASDRLIFPLCALLGAARIIGTQGMQKGLDALCTEPLPFAPRQHEIERRLAMVEQIGGRKSASELSLHLQEEELLPQAGKRQVALHPGSKDSFKRWPASHFIEVGRALVQKFSCQILLTGGREERPLMEEIASQIPGAELIPPNLPLRAFAARLAQIELLISNDTGPFHIACALKKRAIALYGPTDPAICGPYAAQTAHVISAAPSCTPCLKRGCPTPFCLLQIGPQKVLEIASELL